MDLELFASELDAIRAELVTTPAQADFQHLKRVERWGRACTALGYATAWIPPNPISVLLLSLGRFTRWMVAHHVLHKAYDRVPGISPQRTSKSFAKGGRRILDWMDWMHPDAWTHEHNLLHHCRLGESHDPDAVEYILQGWPRWLRCLAIVFFSLTWKASYYGPSTFKQLFIRDGLYTGRSDASIDYLEDKALFSPLNQAGRKVWLSSWLAYSAFQFLLVPCLFAPLGKQVVLYVLLNSLLAELLTNVHGLVMIGPNHTGRDLYMFEGKSDSRGEYYVRQITGSTNYTTGGFFIGFIHGWLNYQIEHHLWPDLTMLQLQVVQPRVQALCAKWRVPYVQEAAPVRFIKMCRVVAGLDRMTRVENSSEALRIATSRS